MIYHISLSIFISKVLPIAVFTFAVLTSISFLDSTKAIIIGEHNLAIKNPFGEGPPEIIMTLNGNTYPGGLRNFIWNSGDVNDNFPVIELPRNNITDILPNKTATTEKGSQVKFAIVGNPAMELQPDRLSVTAYTLDGLPSKLLNVSSNKMNTFDIELNEGKYILLAVAIWLPNAGNHLTTEGYVSYTYRVDVTDQ